MGTAHRSGDRARAWVVAVLAVAALAAPGCGRGRGVEISGAVRRSDGQVVNVGEVWLEPAADSVANARPARRPIRDGRYAFEAGAGVQPGAWIAMVQPPWLGPGASADDLAGAFKPLRRPVTIKPPGEGTNSFDFEVEPVTVRPTE